MSRAFLEALIYGVRRVFDGSGNEAPQRSKIKFSGSTVTDDPDNDQTLVSVPGGGTGDAISLRGTPIEDVAPTDGQALVYNAGDDEYELADVLEITGTLAAGDLLYYDGATLARIPIGTEGQVLKVVSGVPAWADGAAFDPDSLQWNLANLASYSTSPWAGTASAGTSGSYNLAALVGTPDVGAALNGFDSAAFVSANSDCMGAKDGTPANIHWNDVISTTGYYGFALVQIDAALAAPATHIYDNPQLIADNGGNLGVAFSTSGVAAYHTDGSIKATGWQALSISTPHFVEWWYDGANIHIAVDGVEGTPSSSTTTVDSIGAITVRVGVDQSGGLAFTDMSLWEIRVAPTDLSANSADILAYINTRYGLSL